MPKIGVALYANGSPFGRDGNVACEYRNQPFEFTSASDLPGQTLWVTNCSWSDLAEAGLHKSPKIAHDGYYRTKLGQMALEMGLSHLPLSQQAPLLAEVLGNAAEMARLQLGLTQYPTNGLSQAVGQLHGVSEAAPETAEYQVSEQSCQRYTACERERRHEKAEIFSFWLPRYSFAKFMLEQPLPSNNSLSLIQSHQLPNQGQNVIQLVEWASENNLPIFARIKIHALEPTVGKLMNYGSGAQNLNKSVATGAYDARNMREWCALPELEILSQVGEIQILQVAVAGGWKSSGLHLFNSRVSAVSYAYGLVAENLWFGLTRKPTPAASVSKTLSTAWLQSVDRMRCLQVAERLFNIGMEVINYGNGRITVVCPPSVRAMIPQIALEEGLMYPATLPGLLPCPAQQGNASHVLQHLLSKKDYGRIVQVDQLTLKELEASRVS